MKRAALILALCLCGCGSKDAGHRPQQLEQQNIGPTRNEQTQLSATQSQAAGVQVGPVQVPIEKPETTVGAAVFQEKRESESTAGRDAIQHITDLSSNALKLFESALRSMVLAISIVCGMCTTVIGLLAAAYGKAAESSRKREAERHAETKKERDELKRNLNGGTNAH